LNVRKDQPEYLCIDDEGGDRLEAILDRLRRHSLTVTLHPPAAFDDEVALIAESSADGLLLDLRLDDVPGGSGTRVKYRAVALAQELRTRMTEGGVTALPIVLWSVERKFRRSFNSDTTAHDLFDLVIAKTDVSDRASFVARQLVALAKDYPRLTKARTRASTLWWRALGLAASGRRLFDPRIGAELRAGAPAHEYARYILRELLERSGPLVDESLLAVRLGVDMGSTGWDIAKIRLESAVYRGVFGSGWRRWWWPHVESVLRGLSPDKPFRTLAAAERVAILKAGWGTRRLNPPVASPGTGTRYWYVCAATGAPIDPVDAVAVESGDRKAWQDRTYVSMEAVLSRRAAAKGFRIHPLEQPRIDEITRKQ
jgi:hypothetical protein